MDRNLFVQVNVPPPLHVQSAPKREIEPLPESRHHGEARTFGVDKALQYTPLTISVLPAHDRIAIPQISRSRESAKLTSSQERKAVQQTLAQCSTSEVTERLRSLFIPEMLPEYKFKQAPVTVQHAQSSTQPLQSELSLSSVAKMVLDTVSVDYKFSSRTDISKQTQPIFKSGHAPTTVATTTPNMVQRTGSQGNHVFSKSNGEGPAITKPSSGTVVINVPKLSSANQRPAFDDTLGSPNQRKTSRDQTIAATDKPKLEISLHVRSQREAASAALLQFQNTLLEVFEAQDQLDAGSTAVYEAGFFTHLNDGDDSEPAMTNKIMERLQTGLKKLVDMKNLPDMSSEHLRRLQRLCEPSIDKAQTVNLRLINGADSDDQEYWRQNILKAETGLLSAALCLYTILGSPRDESLLSTEALTWIPSALTNIYENCIIPCVEVRPDGPEAGFFAAAISSRDFVRRLLENSRKTFELMSTVCTTVRGVEGAVNPMEFLAAKLLFVQNATTDKSSVLGVQTFEKVRKTAMSNLARIFARFPSERSAILDEVLTSLDKLPSNSRSARQYRLGDGKSIQLISALFLQLVQNTSLDTPQHQPKSKRVVQKQSETLTDDEGEEGDDAMQVVGEDSEVDQEDALSRVQSKSSKLFDGAARSAQEIVLYLVGRASKTTKTGDSPYRNIFDLFIEDMVAVLSSPEWPSSELMLRILAAKMIDMAQHDKTAAAKSMALESLGTMGSAISTLKASLSRQCANLAREGRSRDSTTEHLSKLAADQDQGALRNEDLIAFNGPFATVSRYLWTGANSGLRKLSACGFFLAQYAKVMSLVVDSTSFNESDIESEPVRVANFLLDAIAQIGSGSTTMHNFDAVSSDEAELAYTLSVLNMGFCRRFSVIVKTLSSSFSSDQAQVRSRSLKSVVAMLETDSALLDRDPTIADDVFRCASDDSAMVRDSALSLIAKFIIAKPALEQKGIKRLLECASDAKVGVQKRAIGHLREIYVKDHRTLLKAAISRTFLKRTVDHEDTVADLARKTLIEIWITPTLSQLTQSADLARTKVAIEELTGDIISCISHDSATLCPLLKKFFKSILSGDAKLGTKAHELSVRIVESLFERTISNQDDREPLMVLTAFAEADPQLIPPSQLGKLQPYLGALKSETDLFVFKAVISIFSYVLPHLSASHKPLLLETQNALMKVISSLGRRAELDTVMSCLQVIDGVLQNTMRLIKLAGSIMFKVKTLSAHVQQSESGSPQLLKLLRIGGALARYIDLERYWQQFAQEVKDMKGRSVAEYMALTFLPLTRPNVPHQIRVLALESLGSLCQASPGQFNVRDVRDAFFKVFDAELTKTLDPAQKESLQSVVLRIFEELYAQRAQSKDADNAEGEEEKQDLDKMGGSSKTRDGDSAVSFITPGVVNHALAIALSAPGENVLIATKTLSSVSHQGLTHPKQSLVAFVALSTSPDARVASVAHEAHQLLHRQHESVCEREYMSAVHEAFAYQSQVLGEPTGARTPNYAPKLAGCYKVVDTSGAKYVKKFLSGLVSHISAKLSADDGVLSFDQVQWTRFVVQNMAFFEFSKTDELLHTILQLELAYSKKSAEISQLLEAALQPQPQPQDAEQYQVHTDGDSQMLHPLEVRINDMATVKRLAPLAATLTLMMEARSHLKRQYAVGRDVRTVISNNKQAKDTAKPPTKVHGITGEKFWTRSNAVIDLFNDEDGVLICCRKFVELMSMDDEVNVNEEDGLHEPLDEVETVDTTQYARSGTPAGGRKRKASASASNTPAKRGPGKQRRESRRSVSMSSNDELAVDFED